MTFGRAEIGSLLAAQVRWIPAALFYVIYAAGTLVLALGRRRKAGYASALGWGTVLIAHAAAAAGWAARAAPEG